MSGRARRARQLLDEQGPRGVWFGALAVAGYRRLAIFELALEREPSAISPQLEVSFERLAPAALDEYLAARPDLDPTRVGAWFERGHLCLGARHEGRLVSSAWAAAGSLPSPYLGREIPLGSRESCSFESYTPPEQRGMGLGPALRVAMARQLRESGHTRLLGTVLPENRAAIRIVEKLGYERIGTIGVVRVGPARRDFCRMSGGHEAPGGV